MLKRARTLQAEPQKTFTMSIGNFKMNSRSIIRAKYEYENSQYHFRIEQFSDNTILMVLEIISGVKIGLPIYLAPWYNTTENQYGIEVGHLINRMKNNDKKYSDFITKIIHAEYVRAFGV